MQKDPPKSIVKNKNRQSKVNVFWVDQTFYVIPWVPPCPVDLYIHLFLSPSPSSDCTVLWSAAEEQATGCCRFYICTGQNSSKSFLFHICSDSRGGLCQLSSIKMKKTCRPFISFYPVNLPGHLPNRFGLCPLSLLSRQPLAAVRLGAPETDIRLCEVIVLPLTIWGCPTLWCKNIAEKDPGDDESFSERLENRRRCAVSLGNLQNFPQGNPSMSRKCLRGAWTKRCAFRLLP